MKEALPENQDITLYAYDFPSRAERVLWALEELQLPYQLVRLNGRQGEHRSPEFLAMNPLGKIPVLRHGERVLTESIAIIEYLNGLSDVVDLIPNDNWENYQVRKVISYGLTEIEPYLWTAEQGSRLKHLYQWPEGTYESAIQSVQRALSHLDQWMGRYDYIVADQFSLADLYIHNLLRWATLHKISLSEPQAQYMQKIEARPGFQRYLKVAPQM